MSSQQLEFYWRLRAWPMCIPARSAWEQARTAWFVDRRTLYQRVRLEF